LLLLFLWNEHRSSHALMPLRFFAVANVGRANLSVMPVIAGMFSMFFFVTLYVQQVLGYSPVRTGLGFLPITVAVGIISVNMQHLLPRIGFKKPFAIAPLFMEAGLFWLSHMHVDGTYWKDVFPGLLLVACGMGMVFVSSTVAATNGVEHKDSGLASGLLNTSQQVGGSLGLAILSGVSASAAASYFSSHASQAANPLTRLQAEVNGFHHALYVGMCFAIGASILAFVLVKEKKGEKISTDPADLIAG
jgi:predicted MFS family arabinose efflux permease